MEQKITLFELQEMVKNAIEPLSRGYVWVTAEISEAKRNAGSGHWYLELADYNEEGSAVAAKARAMIWSRSAAMLIPFFESATGEQLAAGMHVLLKVQVQYSVVYGLSLNIVDIDPSFTIGELELQRRNVIKRLEQEGMFGVNSELDLPLLPKRLAIISSETAAGYRDFMKHLSVEQTGIRLYTKLYSAPMQGNDAPDGIVMALEQIVADCENGAGYDAVVIIRGGGSVLELGCFDDYTLAVNIAQYPLPVLTGIGHDHDFHIADMVAHTYFKTPTAVADYIINMYAGEAGVIENMCKRVQNALSKRIVDNGNWLNQCSLKIRHSAMRVLSAQQSALQLLELRIKAASPQEILNKGFAIVSADSGERVRSAEQVKEGDVLKIVLKDGVINVKVID